MSRTLAIAVTFAVISSAAFAAPLLVQRQQLVVPNLNPGLKTVPSVPGSTYMADASGGCEKQLVNRIDSGTVIAGPDGRVAHLTGMASGAWGSSGELVITLMTPDGTSADADFVVCRALVPTDSPEPVAASLDLTPSANLQSIIVHTQSNSIVLYTSKAR